MWTHCKDSGVGGMNKCLWMETLVEGLRLGAVVSREPWTVSEQRRV